MLKGEVVGAGPRGWAGRVRSLTLGRFFYGAGHIGPNQSIMFVSPFPKITAPVLGESKAQEPKAPAPITAAQLAAALYEATVNGGDSHEWNTWVKLVAEPEAASAVSQWITLAQVAIDTINKHNK